MHVPQSPMRPAPQGSPPSGPGRPSSWQPGQATPAIFVVLGLCALAYLALASMSASFEIDPRLIVAYGGLVPLGWVEGSLFRLISAGFLHFSLLHLITNAICLIAWGIPLERRYGSAGVLLLYLGSVVAGNLASLALHSGPFISAGASGGASGLLGALLMLTLAGHLSLPLSFFAINIGLNIVIAVLAPNVDWQCHLGGFLGGMALALLLSLLRRR